MWLLAGLPSLAAWGVTGLPPWFEFPPRHRAFEPQDPALKAVREAYTTASGSDEVQALRGDEVLPFYREWHDKLLAAAERAPAGWLKSNVLGEVTVLAASDGERVRAAQLRADLPADAVGPADSVDAQFALVLALRRAADGDDPDLRPDRGRTCAACTPPRTRRCGGWRRGPRASGRAG